MAVTNVIMYGCEQSLHWFCLLISSLFFSDSSYSAEQQVIFWFLFDNNSEDDELKKKINSILSVYHNWQSINSDSPFNITVNYFEANHNSTYTQDTPWNNVVFVSSCTKWNSLFKQKINITTEDKILLCLQNNHQLEVALSALSCFSRKQIDNQISVVCECDYYNYDDSVISEIKNSRLNILKDAFPVAVTGLNQYSANYNYSICFQTASLLYEIINFGQYGLSGICPLLFEGNTRMIPIKAFNSISFSNALTRIAFLSELRTMGSELSEFYHRMRIDNPEAVWHNGSRMEILDDINVVFCNINSTNIDFDTHLPSVKGALKKLNKVEREKKTVSDNVKFEHCFNHLVNTIFSFIPDNSQKSVKIMPHDKEYNVPPSVLLEQDTIDQSISPTFWFELTNHSFSESFSENNTAQKIRSFVLNLWENFFSSKFKSSYDISEYLMNNNWFNLLDVTDCGRELCKWDVLYFVNEHDSGKPFIAVSSPYTGFAPLSKNAFEPLNTDKVIELSKRDNDFQLFMAMYINMFPTDFSLDFRQYIINQTKAIKRDLEKTAPMISLKFEDFSKHIPLDFKK